MATTLLCLSFAGALAAPVAPGVAVNMPALCLTAEAAPSPAVSAGLSAATFASSYALAGTGLSLSVGGDKAEGGKPPIPAVSSSTWRIVGAILGLEAAQD